jgi:hypothetical protein
MGVLLHMVGKVVPRVPGEGDGRVVVDLPVSVSDLSRCETCERVVAMPVPWPTTDDGGHAKVSCNHVPAMRTGQR